MGFDITKTPRKYPRLGDVVGKYGSSAELSIGLDTPPKAVKTGVKEKSVSPISSEGADAAAMDLQGYKATDCEKYDMPSPTYPPLETDPVQPLETDPTCPCPPPKCEKPVEPPAEIDDEADMAPPPSLQITRQMRARAVANRLQGVSGLV